MTDADVPSTSAASSSFVFAVPYPPVIRNDEAAKLSESDVQKSFDNFNKAKLNLRKNRRSSLNIRFGLRDLSSPRHNRHQPGGPQSPTGASIFHTPTKTQPPPEQNLTPSQRRKLHEEQENEKIAELLAQTNKKWIGNNFETLLIERLPDVVERQPLMSVGTLLDASAKIYAYKVDKTLQDCCHAKRDIEKPEKHARKMEKLEQLEKDFPMSGAPPVSSRPEYAEHEISERDLFRHVTVVSDSEISREVTPVPIMFPVMKQYSDEEEAEAAFKMPEDFSLFKKTKRRKRPAGAPDSDDDYESVKQRNERIRQKCFQLSQNPRMKLVMTDSSDEECCQREKDAKLYDYFECVQFRNTLLQQDARKLIKKDADYDPENDEKELYNPRYSKTVRRTGATSSSFMLNNVSSNEQGSIMLLHDRPFTSLKRFPEVGEENSSTHAEVSANCDLAGVMQQVLLYDRRSLRHLFPSVNRENFQEAVKNRKSRAAVIRQMKEQLEENADSAGVDSDEARSKTCSFHWRDDLLDPRLFRDDRKDEKSKARKGKRNDKRKKKKVAKQRAERYVDSDDDMAVSESREKKKVTAADEVLVEEMEVDQVDNIQNLHERPVQDSGPVIDDYDLRFTLENPPFSDKEVEQQRRNLNCDFLAALTQEDAKNLGISDRLLGLLLRDGQQGGISDELRTEISAQGGGSRKNALLEVIFGGNFGDSSVANKRKLNSGTFKDLEKQMKAVKYIFTEDYADLDGMWHCDAAAIEADNADDGMQDNEGMNTDFQKRADSNYSYVLTKGTAEKPLYWDEDQHSMSIRSFAPGKFRRLHCKIREKFTVRDVPKICDIRRMQLDKFFDSEQQIEQCNMPAAFHTIENAYGEKERMMSRGNFVWKATEGYRPMQLENYDFNEVAQSGPRQEVRRILEGGDNILMTEEMPEYDYADPPSFARFDNDNELDAPGAAGADSDDLLARFEKGEDLNSLLKKDKQANKENANVGPKPDFEDQALGELLTGDAEHAPLPHMIDDCHWRAQQPEPEKPKKRGVNKVLFDLEKFYFDKGYWEYLEDLPAFKNPRISLPKTVNYAGKSWNKACVSDDDIFSTVKATKYEEFENIIQPSSYAPFYGTWPKGRTYSIELVAKMTTYQQLKLEICCAVNNRKERSPTPPTFNQLFGKYGRHGRSPSRTVLETYPEDRSTNRELEGIEEEPEEPEISNEIEINEGGSVENPAECLESQEVPDDGEPESYSPEPYHNDDDCGIDIESAPLQLPTAQQSVRAEEDDDEMFGRRYKITQSRVNAPLVKKAIAAILANAAAEDMGPLPFIEECTPSPVRSLPDEQPDGEVEMTADMALLRTIKQEVLDEDEIEQAEVAENDEPNDVELMKIRVCDFPVVGSHTFTNLMARLPAFLNKQSIEDLKPSNALTILLHMCNENKLELAQNRDRRTKEIVPSALDDFIIRPSVAK